MKIFVLLILSIIISPAYAETFETITNEAITNEDYLLLEINDEKANGIMRLDGRIISFEENVKFYNNGNFLIKLFGNKIILSGVISEDSFNVTIYDKNKDKATIEIYKVDTFGHVPKQQEHEGYGDLRVIEKVQEEPEKIIETIPRTEYMETDFEMAILQQMPLTVPTGSFFDLDIRLVDGTNNLFSYFETLGYVDGADIKITIKDPDGKIIKNINGTTTNKGHFGVANQIYFNDNTESRYPFILEISATKYFDKDKTFSVTSLVKEFFVYYSSKGISNIVPPTGTIIIEKVNGVSDNELTPITLSCIPTVCDKMIFSLNNTNFTGEKIFDFETSHTYFFKDMTYNILYVQFIDSNGIASVDEIFDDVFIRVSTVQ